MRQSCPPGLPYPTALCPGALSQQNLLLCQHMYLLRQFISECETRDRFLAPEGVPLPATVRSLGQGHPLEEGMAPTPIFSPWESHGQRSLADYSLQGHRESGTTEEKVHVLSEKSESAEIETVQYGMIPLHIKFYRKGSGWLFHGRKRGWTANGYMEMGDSNILRLSPIFLMILCLSYISYSEKVWKNANSHYTNCIWTWNFIPVLRNCILDSYLLKCQESKSAKREEQKLGTVFAIGLCIWVAFTQIASHLWQPLLPTHT